MRGDRHGMGVSFDCPTHRTHRLAVWFANPLDGGAQLPVENNECRWSRTGDTFETISLSPSVDASAYCGCGRLRRRRPQDPPTFELCNQVGPDHTPCWHGFLVSGAVG